MKEVAFLALAFLVTFVVADDCLQKYCSKEMTACFSDAECEKILQCMSQNCTKNPEARCPYDCGYFDGNANLHSFLQCQANYGCVSQDKPVSGICYIKEDEPGPTAIPHAESFKGTAGEPKKIWRVKGLNCNQDATWFGGYDNTPCASSTSYTDKISKFTTCYGAHDECETDYIEVWSTYRTTKRPDIYLSYLWGKGIVQPQTATIQVLSAPNPDWFMVASCNETPYIKINTVSIMSSKKSYGEIPQEVEDEFKAVAAKLGFSLDDMCEKDASNCADPQSDLKSQDNAQEV